MPRSGFDAYGPEELRPRSSVRVYHGNREVEPTPADPAVAALLGRLNDQEERLRALEARCEALEREREEEEGDGAPA